MAGMVKVPESVDLDVASKLFVDGLVVREMVELPCSWQFAPDTAYGPTHATTKTATVLTQDTMRTAQFEVHMPAEFVELGIRVSSGAAGATIHLMVFEDDGYGRPGDLLLDAGTDDASYVHTVEMPVSWAAVPGTYHLAVAASGGSPTVFMYTGAAPNVSQSVSNSTLYSGFTASYSGTAPSVFGSTTRTTHAPFIIVTTAP